MTMDINNKNYAIQAISWVREGSYIKVPHPITNRQIYLTNEKADVFELLDEGLNTDEMFCELKKKHSDITLEKINKTIQLLCELNLVQVVDQFDN